MSQGGSGSTSSFHIDRRYTTLELTSQRDSCNSFHQTGHNNLPALLVHGGAKIMKTLCATDVVVEGDTIIEGNLVVLGATTIETTSITTVQDKNICLGNVIGMPASDVTANTGGILLKSTPTETKSWVWISNLGNGGAWNSNQDINLGVGQLNCNTMSACVACGSDHGLRGTTYRIDNEPVLSIDSLGPTVLNSSLETVGTLYQGAIFNAYYIQSTIPGVSSTTIITTQPNGYSVGDQVVISGSNSSPSLDGCNTIDSIISATTFTISTGSVTPANIGFVKGPTFPIDIGTSPIWSGTHTIGCGNELIVLNNSQAPRFVMDGSAEQLSVVNSVSPSFTQSILSTISGSHSGLQRGLYVANQSDSTTVGSSNASAAIDIVQTYDGASTFFADNEMAVQILGQQINVTANPQSIVPRFSARGIDITVNSINNRGSNIGVYAEAGGALNCQHAAGIFGFTNSNSGIFSTGVMGCANRTRQEMADEVSAIINDGGATVGGYFCNPLMGEHDYALWTEGQVQNNGDVVITGNLTVYGFNNLTANISSICIPTLKTNNLSACGANPTHINVDVDLIPATGNLSLGSPTQPWNYAHINNLQVYNNLRVDGNVTYIGTEVLLVQDNFITLNTPPQIDNCDAGMLVHRYQIDSDTCEGNVIQDAPESQGILQSAWSTQAQLSAASSIDVDYYKYWWIKISSGPGACQVRQITAYDGITKIAVLSSAWTIIPTAGDTYELFAGNYTGIYWDESEKKWFFATTANAYVRCIRDGQHFLQDICVRELLADTIDAGNIYANIAAFPQLYADTFDSIGPSLTISAPISITLNTPNTEVLGNLIVGGKLITDDFQVNNNMNVGGAITANILYVYQETILDGNVVINSDLFVNGTTYSENLDITNDTHLHGNLIVDGHTILNGEVTVVGNITLEQNVLITGKTTISGDIHITGNTFIDGRTIFTDDVDFFGNVYTHGKLIVDDLEVLQSSHFYGNVIVDGISTFVGPVVINGTQTVNGNSTFVGTIVAENSVIIEQNLMVNGDIYANSNVNVAGVTNTNQLHVTGNAILEGETLFNGNIYVTQNTTTDTLVVIHGSHFVGDVYVAGNTTVNNFNPQGISVFDGPSVFNNSIDMNGDLHLFGNLIVEQQTIFLGPVDAFGNVTYHGLTTFEGDLQINGNTIVYGQTIYNNEVTFNSNVHVRGTIDINDLNVTGQSTFLGNVYIDNGIIVNGISSLEQVIVGDGGLDVVGNVVFQENLIVLGDSLLNNVHVTGNAVIDGTLSLSGNVTANYFFGNVIQSSGNGGLTVEGVTHFYNDLTTTGSTDELVVSVPLSDYVVFLFETKAVGTNNASSTNARALVTKQAFYNDGGSIVNMGQPITPDSWASGSGSSTWSIYYVPNGTNLEVWVHGQTGKTIHWRATVEIVRL